MRKLTKEQVNDILTTSIETGSRADLSDVDLTDMDLRGVDLSGTILAGSILINADLTGTNLQNADLRGTILSSSTLHGADMRFAQAAYACFDHAALCGADLRNAVLSFCIFGNADLSNAIVNPGTDFRGTYVGSACLDNVSGLDSACPVVCPETGSFVGWKKARMLYKNPVSGYHYVIDSVIVKIRILEDAKRSSATSRKCRCSAAMVEEIQTLDGKSIIPDSSLIICSRRDPEFIYETGKIVSVSDFDPNRWNECSTGIHFFITREEAVNY